MLEQQITLLMGVKHETPAERLTDDMRARQKKILQLLKTGGKTTKVVAAHLDLTYDATRWTLQRMPEVKRVKKLWQL